MAPPARHIDLRCDMLCVVVLYGPLEGHVSILHGNYDPMFALLVGMDEVASVQATHATQLPIAIFTSLLPVHGGVLPVLGDLHAPLPSAQNDLIERLLGDPAFASVHALLTPERLLDPMQYVGRSVEQTERFVREVVGPLRERHAEELAGLGSADRGV